MHGDTSDRHEQARRDAVLLPVWTLLQPAAWVQALAFTFGLTNQWPKEGQ